MTSVDLRFAVPSTKTSMSLAVQDQIGEAEEATVALLGKSSLLFALPIILFGCDKSTGPDSNAASTTTPTTQPAPASQPAVQTPALHPNVGSAQRTAAAPASEADNPKVRFLKTVGKPVWERQNRQQWLRSHGNVRLVGQEPATGFLEYAGGDNLAKTHAVFTNDHMSLWELIVIRGNQAQAERDVGRFEDALGPADLDSPPANLPERESSGTTTFRQWDVQDGGRHIVVRCMIRLGETNDGTPVYYLQQTFLDMAAAAAGG